MKEINSNKITYTRSNTINNNLTNSFEKTKNLFQKKFNFNNILNKNQIMNKNRIAKGIPNNYNYSKKYIQKEAWMRNYKIDSINISSVHRRNNYSSIIISKSNINRTNKASNSFNKKNPLICCCCCCCNCFFTPIRHLSLNIKNELKNNSLTNKRCVTIENLKKRKFDAIIKPNKENKLMNNIKVNNKSIKKGKLEKESYKKKDIKNQRIDFKDKNIIEKLKKVRKKKKYDLKTINDVNSKEERIRNLLYGISYMKQKKECELCHKIVESHTYKFHYYTHPSLILNWMFLGTFKNANNIEELKIFGIKYILNCALEIIPRNIPSGINYCHINLTDNPNIDITQFFDEAFSFIELARKNGGKLLVHCKLGISRSPAILIGYFIKYKGFSNVSALNFLKLKRTQVHPNQGFISQLNSYEKKIKKNQKRNFNSNISNYTTDFSSTNNLLYY